MNQSSVNNSIQRMLNLAPLAIAEAARLLPNLNTSSVLLALALSTLYLGSRHHCALCPRLYKSPYQPHFSALAPI